MDMICQTCGEILPESEFPYTDFRHTRKNNVCRRCREHSRNRRTGDRHKHRAGRRSYWAVGWRDRAEIRLMATMIELDMSDEEWDTLCDAEVKRDAS